LTTLATVLTTPRLPVPPPKKPGPPKDLPEFGTARPDGVRVRAGLELRDARATDNPATVRASTPATIQATVVLRKNPVTPRRSLPEGIEDGAGDGGHP